MKKIFVLITVMGMIAMASSAQVLTQKNLSLAAAKKIVAEQ